MSDKGLSFWEHVDELRKVLIRSLSLIGIASSFCFFLTPQIFKILAATAGEEGKKFILLSPMEGVTTSFKAAFFCGLFLSSPFWMYLILTFIAPALRGKEKKIIPWFLFTSLTMLFLGTLFSLKVTLPLANQFFLSFNSYLGENLWSLSYYFDYTLFLCISGGVTFEIFAVLLFLIYFGIITEKQMREKRRVAVVLSFLLAAILTPPDVLTQILVALPLILFYEAGILYGKLSSRGSESSHKLQ